MSLITIIQKPVSLEEIKKNAIARHGDMAKAVVDIQRCIMAVGGDLHADEEAVLLDQGSKQADLWGINIYHDLPWPDMIEFDSMINLRPQQDNKSRGVESEEVRKKIMEIVRNLIMS